MNNEGEWINHDLPFDHKRPLTQIRVRNSFTGSLSVVSGLRRELVQAYTFLFRKVISSGLASYLQAEKWEILQTWFFFDFALIKFMQNEHFCDILLPFELFLILLNRKKKNTFIRSISPYFITLRVLQAHLKLLPERQPSVELGFFFRLLFLLGIYTAGSQRASGRTKRKAWPEHNGCVHITQCYNIPVWPSLRLAWIRPNLSAK